MYLQLPAIWKAVAQSQLTKRSEGHIQKEVFTKELAKRGLKLLTLLTTNLKKKESLETEKMICLFEYTHAIQINMQQITYQWEDPKSQEK